MKVAGGIKGSLLKRLLDRAVDRINSQKVRPVLYDILETLDACYLLLSIQGEDGGDWLYFIKDGMLHEREPAEMEGQEYKLRHFYISTPDFVLYDVLLKVMTPAESIAYVSWGGTQDTHPASTFLRSTKFLELLTTAVDLGV